MSDDFLGFSRRGFLASLGALPAALWAQDSSSPASSPAPAPDARAPEPTFSSDVKVVSVLATVRSKHGTIVADLGKDDFLISEEGRPQTIKYFSRETNLPLSLGLLVDTSLSQRGVLEQERTASFRFLDKVLRADLDQTFVIHFDRETELLQDLTSSRPLLQRALDKLELPAGQQQQQSRGGGGGNSGGGYPGGGGGGGGIGFPGGGIGFPGGGRRRGGGGGGYPGGGGRQGGGRRGGGGPGTTLYDAILLASDEIMRKRQGRKALILLTDGVDNGSKTFLHDAIEAAQRADTLVYSILFTDRLGGMQGVGRRMGGNEGADGKKVLQQISGETGGAFFEVSKKLSIDDIYDRIQEELRNQYNIGYSSDATEASSGFRAIQLTTKRAGLVVQARQGYYPGAAAR